MLLPLRPECPSHAIGDRINDDETRFAIGGAGSTKCTMLQVEIEAMNVLRVVRDLPVVG